jgi:hypothetical protein
MPPARFSQKDNPMSQELPDYYMIDGQRVAAPTYEALAQCQIIMVGETGNVGPTLVEAGEIFSTEATPCMAWAPLNRAAADRYQAWLDALPLPGGADLTMDEITEAAQALRPREGEPTLPHEQWWPTVIEYAKRKKQTRKGMVIPEQSVAYRPGNHNPIMPFVQAGAATPMDAGKAPMPQAPTPQFMNQAQAARRPGRPRKDGGEAMSNVAPVTPAQATG